MVKNKTSKREVKDKTKPVNLIPETKPSNIATESKPKKKEMTFVWESGSLKSNNYTAPSGITYAITKGMPFKVTSPLDFDYFRKKNTFRQK